MNSPCIMPHGRAARFDQLRCAGTSILAPGKVKFYIVISS